jgi:hypothetical protein
MPGPVSRTLKSIPPALPRPAMTTTEPPGSVNLIAFVQQDLLQARGVDDEGRQQGVDLYRQLHMSGIRPSFHQRDAIADNPVCVHSLFFVEFEFSGIYLRKIENIVDDVMQVLAALVNETGIFHL